MPFCATGMHSKSQADIVLNSMSFPAIIRLIFENGSLKIKLKLHRLRSIPTQKETNNAIITSGKSQ